jgi:hypothetical protein
MCAVVTEVSEIVVGYLYLRSVSAKQIRLPIQTTSKVSHARGNIFTTKLTLLRNTFTSSNLRHYYNIRTFM